MNSNPALAIAERAKQQPHSPALIVNDASLTYQGLTSAAQRIAGWLLCEPAGSRRVGILAGRSELAYVGILAALWSGAAYVPINVSIPEERLLHILRAAEFDALILDKAGMSTLSERVLAAIPNRLLIAADATVPSSLVASPRLQVSRISELADEGPSDPATLADDALAYIIFTSGTTGIPKGVMIEAGSLMQFYTVVQERCEIRENDRILQMADLSFDLSVLGVFAAWSAGAALYVVPDSELISPHRFVKKHSLTIWISVPSAILFMERLNQLEANAFPSIRYSIFCGETLPIRSAQMWQKACPNSVVDNLYGPTEFTVACTGLLLRDPPDVTRNRASLGIGSPFPEVSALIIDAEGGMVEPEGEGELILAGRQIARGYLNDKELTERRFPTLQGRRWYRTGDLAYQAANGSLHHLGRVDNQVKLLGYRVELEEIETHLRQVVGSDLVAAVAWPIVENRATGIAAFHCSPGISREDIRRSMKSLVPDYMIPQRVYYREILPTGGTGKIDRKALLLLLESGQLA